MNNTENQSSEPNVDKKNSTLLLFKNKTLIFSILIGLVLLIGGGIWYSADLNAKADNEKKENDRISLENKKKEESKKLSEAQNPLQIVSSLNGKTFTSSRISLLTSALVFPEGEITFKQGGSFEVSASGFNLGILGNESLKVDGVYPTAAGLASGTGFINKDGKTFNLSVSSLQVQFLAGEEILDSAKSAEILAALSSIGLVIPVATDLSPVIVNASIVLNEPKLTIRSTPDSAYLLNFEGSLKK